MFCTDMQLHLFRILHTERMTIHAIPIGLRIIQDSCFLKVFYVPLIDTHLIPHFISWRYQTISQIRVYLFFCNLHIKSFIGLPPFITLDTMFYFNGFTFCIGHQIFPCSQIRNQSAILANHSQRTIIQGQNQSLQSILCFYKEINWSNVGRYDDVCIFFH